MSKRVAKLFIALLCLWTPLHSVAVRADEWSAWRFYAETIVEPQADDAFYEVYADFAWLLRRDVNAQSTFDARSVRVAAQSENGAWTPVPSRFIAEGNDATGRVVFFVAGEAERKTRAYRVYFDTRDGAPKPATPFDIEVPDRANLIWNDGLEVLSLGYKGRNRFLNSGKNMPQGWWGNIQNMKLEENPAREAHSGRGAFAFVSREEGKNAGMFAAPTNPGQRIAPGETYTFSFWAKGEKLSGQHRFYAYVYWYREDKSFLSRLNIAGLGAPNFAWRQWQIALAAPPEAYFAAFNIGTYSTTGLVTVDDFAMRRSVPPLLENARLNQ